MKKYIKIVACIYITLKVIRYVDDWVEFRKFSRDVYQIISETETIDDLVDGIEEKL